MLRVENIRKAYGDHPVLKGVDLDVGAGAVLGLVGANGAGKTSLISIIAGLLPPDSGRVSVDGIDVWPRPSTSKAAIGLAPQQLGIYPTLSVGENLVCFARLSGVPRRQAKTRAAEVAEMVGLNEQWQRKAELLSGGQQRRLHTAMAVLHRPRLLFLDEPTVGADVQSRTGILEIVRDLAARGTTVVYTTHYLTELEQLGAEIAVLDEGRIVERGAVRHILSCWAQASVRLRFHGPVPDLDGWIAEADTLVPTRPPADPGAAAAAALAALGDKTSALVGVEITGPSLESAYLAITGRTMDEEVGDAVAA